MTDGKELNPIFIVGTRQEVGFVESAGLEAWSTRGLDAQGLANMALRVATEGRPAIVLLDEDDGEAAMMDALLQAGAVARAITQESQDRHIPEGITSAEEMRSCYVSLCRDEAAHEVRNYEERKAEAKARQLQALHVHDTMEVAMELCSLIVTREHIPTGLANLDKAVGGGLPEGALTVLGAGSSSGKTTLAVQIADHIAASGRTVLFVTTEQSRHELVAKSLSRMMKQTKKPNGGYYVASAEHIMSRAARASWDGDKEDALRACGARYTMTIAPRMRYFEVDGQPTVEQIRRAYKALCEPGKPSPVLVVDYLQLLKSQDEHMSDRRAVDVNVMELRQLARESNSAVILISSINRQSYSEGADMSAFKESGGIEYGADLAMMLQPRGYGDKVGKEKTDKAARERARELMAEHKGSHLRKSELVILKNRGGGMPNKPVPLMYDAMLNEFTEDNDPAAEATRKKPL